MPGLTTFTSRCGSLDELLCKAQRLGIGVEACQLDCMPAEASLAVCATLSSAVMRFRLGNRTHLLLPSREGFHTFGLLTRSQRPAQIHGRPFRPSDMVLVDPDTGLDVVHESGFSVFTLAVAEQRLREVAARHRLPDPAGTLNGAGISRPVRPALLRNLRTLCHLVFSGNRRSPPGRRAGGLPRA